MSARTRANLSLFSVAALSLVAGGALALQFQPVLAVQASPALAGRGSPHPRHVPGGGPPGDRWRREHQHHQGREAPRHGGPVPVLLRRHTQSLFPSRGPWGGNGEGDPAEPGLRLHRRQGGVRPHQPPRGGRRRRHSGHHGERQEVRGQARGQGRPHRRGAAQDRAPGAPDRDRAGRLRSPRRGRVGDGDREPLRPRRQQRDRRGGVLQGPAPRPVHPRHPGRDDPDRRLDQPRQLRGSPPRHPGAGGGDQHPDHHHRLQPVLRGRLRGADQRRQGDPPPAPRPREGRARLARRKDPGSRRGPGQVAQALRGQGRPRQRRDRGQPRGESRPQAG